MQRREPEQRPRPITDAERRATQNDTWEEYMRLVRGDDDGWWDQRSYIDAQIGPID